MLSDIEYRRNVKNAKPEIPAQAMSLETENECPFLVRQGAVAENETPLLYNLEVYDPIYIPERERN